MGAPLIAFADGGTVNIACEETVACPAGQTGSQIYTCSQSVNGGSCTTDPDGSLKTKPKCKSTTINNPSYSKYWKLKSSSCVASGPTYVSTQTETQWLSCPANTPSGSIYQNRTYDVYSDGSTQNYSDWTVYNNCYNQAPTVQNVSLSTPEDTPLSAALSASDDGPFPYTFQILGGPANGSASISGNTLSFTPNQDWNGVTTITYRVQDGAGAWSAAATITITVTPVNDPPVAQAKTLTMAEDTTGSVTLSATDIDSPAPTVFQIVANSPYGTATISGSTMTFIPVANWNGTTLVTYRAQDSAGAWSSPATVSITVTAVNDPPSVDDLQATTAEDTALAVTLPVHDVDLSFEGDSHTFAITALPPAAAGTASISGNKLTFVPATNWNGTTTLKYQATDSRGAKSNIATLTITVTPVNDTPSVDDLQLTTAEDTAGAVTLPVHDVDLAFEGDSHTFAITAAPPAAAGIATISGNRLTFVPAPNWNGTTTLRYQATDSHGAKSNVATLTITVTPVNDTPSVDDLQLTTAEDTTGAVTLPVHDVDLAFEGDSHTFIVTAAPPASAGKATISGNQLTFVPTANWNGTTTLKYQATDSHGAKSNIATMTITVTPVNDTPSVDDLQFTTNEDTAVEATLPVHDVDLDFEGDSHTFSIVTAPEIEHGAASISGNKLTFTPSLDWNGKTTLQYQATDSHGAKSNVGTVTITVVPVNDAPQATGATIVTDEGKTSSSVIPWVVDPDLGNGDTFTFQIIGQPVHGSIKLVAGALVYTPSSQYFGDDALTIRATDSGGLWVDGQVRVVVNKFNYAPTDILPHTLEMYAGIGGSAELAVVDPNLWGATSLQVVQQPSNGEVSISGNTLTYRTDDDQPATVRLRATDQDGLFVEKDIKLTFKPAWEFFDGREVVTTKAVPRIPAVAAQLVHTNGQQAFQVSQPEVLESLGNDLVAIVTPSSSVGVTLQHRQLAPGIGMRLVPKVLTATDLQSPMGALNIGVAGTSNVYLSRADRTGPVYSVPVSIWAFEGALAADNWSIYQGTGRTAIRVEQSNGACALLTNAQMAKSRNALDTPTCFLSWTGTPDEWKDTSSSTNLAMVAAGMAAGKQLVQATAFVFDQSGQPQKMVDIKHDLIVKPLAGQLGFALSPQVSDVYQKVQSLSLSLKSTASQATCTPTVSADMAKKSAQQWQTNVSCLIQWIQLPEGMVQPSSTTDAKLNGSMNVPGLQSIGWNVTLFTPSGAQIDGGNGGQDFNVVPPPAIDVSLPTTNFVKEGMYWVSQAGGSVGAMSISAIAADLTYQATLDGAQLENSVSLSYGQAQRFTRYISGQTAPLWSQTPFVVDVAYRALPEAHTKKTVQLLAVPKDSIKPVILNDERQVLDTDGLAIKAGIRDTVAMSDPYSLSTMGDWDIRLLSTTSGVNYQQLADWQPIDAEGNATFKVDLTGLTNKAVRIIAEARVHSPVPEYSLTRQGSAPLMLTVLNGEALDGKIQALRILGPAPLKNSFYAVTTDRTQSRDLGEVVWELSKDEGVTWDVVSSDPKLPQHLSYTFPRGHYLLRAQLTNRNSGAKSTTPVIDITAFVVPQARLKGPQNVFIGDTAIFKLVDLQGQPLDTSDMTVDWSLDRGKTWVPSSTGDGVYRLTRDEAVRVTLYGRLKYNDSPDHPSVYKKVTVGVAFRQIRPPRVQLIGPGHPEVDTKGTWKANMMLPYPNMDVTMDGYFIMPNGEQVHSLQAEYTPTSADMSDEKTYIGFQGWINGYEDRGGSGLTQKLLQFWKYVWPDWYIQSKTSAIYAPADLTMTARNRGTFQQFEGLKIDWDVPPYEGMSVVKDSDQKSRIVRVTEPGTYQFGYTVTDARGNLSTVSTEMEFLPPPDWNVLLSWSGDNKFGRAPLGVLVRPSISGGHPKDRILTKAYTLDGKALDSTGDYGRATLATPGPHTVTMNITTEMGHEASGEVQIPVVANQAPSCSLEVTNGRTSWLAKATCTDPDGRVSKNNWYINGEKQALNSNNISIPMWRYPDGEPVITLIGIDDSGAESPPVANK
ncbi:Ig-like domain-containing protein [Pseudomonas sp. PDM19]|uniref:Ig-like domain-containing protein n=1 Tax=Pseudomonas sp. PDM19 TaxID=2769272 RepID=UPI001CE199D9|nr:Ig-like domain-containing protein [Pseudomonas sp. PDM19]